MRFSPDCGLAFSAQSSIKVWQLDWELEDREPSDWDEGARQHLETFLCRQTPYAGTLPQDREPTEEEITASLTRKGTPSWTEADFQNLLYSLGCAGYGWLRPEGIRRELDRMVANWEETLVELTPERSLDSLEQMPVTTAEAAPKGHVPAEVTNIRAPSVGRTAAELPTKPERRARGSSSLSILGPSDPAVANGAEILPELVPWMQRKTVRLGGVGLALVLILTALGLYRWLKYPSEVVSHANSPKWTLKLNGSMRVPGNKVAISPNGRWIASEGRYRLQIADTQTGALKQELDGHLPKLNLDCARAWSPDGKTIVLDYDGKARVIDIETGKPKYSLTGEPPISANVFTKDGNTLLVRSSFGLASYDAQTGELKKQFSGILGDVSDLDYSTNGTLVVASGNHSRNSVESANGSVVRNVERGRSS